MKHRALKFWNTTPKAGKIWFFSGCAVLSILIFIGIQTGAILSRIQPKLEAQIKSALPGREVRTGRLSTNYLNALSWSDIEISNAGGFDKGRFLKVSRLKFKFNLLNLVRLVPNLIKKDPEAALRTFSIARFELIEPEVMITRQDGRWVMPQIQKKGGKAGAGMVIPVHVRWKKARIYVSADEPKLNGLEIQNSDGEAAWQAGDAFIEFEAQTLLGEKFSVKGELKDLASVTVNIRAGHFNVGNALQRFSIVSSSAQFRGAVNASLDLSAPLPLRWAGRASWKFAGSVEPEDLSCTLPYGKGTRAFSVEGRVHFSDAKVEASSLTIRTSSSQITMSGSILSPVRSPFLRARAEADLDLSEWLVLPGSGSAHLSLSCSGAPENIEVQSDLRVSSAVLSGIPLSSQVQLSFSSHTWNLHPSSLRWGAGKVSAEGQASKEKLAFKVKADALSLKEFFAGREYSCEGKVSGVLEARGTASEPAVDGKLKIAGFAWGANRLPVLSGSLKAARNSVRFQLSSSDSKNKLFIEAARSGARIELKNCSALVGGTERASIRAAIDTSSRTVTGQVSAESVSTARIAPFLDLLSHFDGRTFMKGRIEGTLDEPLMTGSISGTQLAVYGKDRASSKPESVGNLRSSFHWDKHSFQLKDIRLGESVFGSFAYWKRPIWKFEVHGRAANANPKVLFALMNSPTDMEGKVNGTLDLSRRKSEDPTKKELPLEGSGALSIEQGRWGITPFEKISIKYRFDRTKLELADCIWAQKDGSLSLRWTSGQTRGKNPFKGEARCERFEIGGVRLDGTAAAEGDFYIEENMSLSGSARSDDLAVNGFKPGPAQANVAYGDSILNLSPVTWGGAIKGNCLIRFGNSKSPLLSGSWNSTERPIREWTLFPKIEAVPVEGNASISGNLAGTLSEPEIELRSTLSGIRFTGKDGGPPASETLKGTASAVYSGSALNSLDCRLKTASGGQLSASGKIDIKKKTLSIRSSCTALDSALVLRMLGFETFSSRTDGTLEAEGNWLSPSVRAKFSGKEGVIGKIPLESWDAAGTFKKNEVRLSKSNFYGKNRSWRFTALDESWIRLGGGRMGSFRLSADFANIVLGPVFFVGNAVAEGRWAPDEKNGKPRIEASVGLGECIANHFEIHPQTLRFSWNERTLKFIPSPAQNAPSLSGEIDFSNEGETSFKNFSVTDSGKKIFFLDGLISAENPSFKVQGTGVNAALVASILKSPLEISGTCSLKAEGKKVNDVPQIAGEITLENGKIADIPLDRLASKVRWENGMLSIDTLEAESRQYFKANASGRMPLAAGTVKPKHPDLLLRMKITGGNLALLDFLEDDRASGARGNFSASLSLKGSPERPNIDGLVEIHKGELDSKYLGRKAKDIEVRAPIKANKLTFEKAQCRVGDSTLLLSGTLACGFEAGDISLDDFNLNLKTKENKGVPIRAPELPASREKLGILSAPSRATPVFDLKLTGRKERPKISGWVRLENALFSYPPPEKSADSHSWFDSAEWDLRLKTGKQTVYQNDFVYAVINGELTFKGTKEDLLVNGKVTSDNGSIALYGAKFDLVNASLEVVQPQSLNIVTNAPTSQGPKNIVYLQLKAEQKIFVNLAQTEQQVQDTVTIQLERTPLTEQFDPKKLTFRSSQNPDLTSDKVATRAGMGVDMDNLTPDERDAQLRQGIARLLDSQLASPLARAVLQRTGLVSRIEISQDQTTTRSESIRGTQKTAMDPFIGQSILLEKSFGSSLGIGYKTTFDRIQDKADLIHQVQLRYTLPFYRGVWLYGVSDLDSKENLGREPERKGGIQWGTKFDFSDLFGKKKKDAAKKTD